jgi:ubiquitin-conjugating enzyme E2 I
MVCLSITNAHQDWKPAITVKQILLGIQTLLNEPNLNSPANSEASNTLRKSKEQYLNRIKQQTAQFTPS